MSKRFILWLLKTFSLQKSRQNTNAPLKNAKSALFICFSPHLGSIMCSTPILGAIKKSMPHITIGVVCDSFNSAVFRYSPYVDELLIAPNPQQYFIRSCIAFFRLRTTIKRYEWLVVDSANGRNINLIPVLLTGRGKIAGFGDASALLSYRIPYPPQGTSEIEGNMALLKTFGSQAIQEIAEPELFYSADDEESMNRFLVDNGLGSEQVIIAIQTQSKDNKPNRWRENRFAELADRIVGELGAAVVFTGSQRETENIERIRRMMKQASVSSAGKTTVLQLAALLKHCRLFITLDTGSMHVGRAVKVPMVILASAYQAPEIWLPVNNPNCLILRKGDIPCALCYNDFCTTLECMDAISVAEVFEVVHQWIKKHDFVRA